MYHTKCREIFYSRKNFKYDSVGKYSNKITNQITKFQIIWPYQSTKNSILPSLGFSANGKSTSSLTATNTSVLASLILDEPKACDTTPVSSSMGR